jgi:hypothetical protein
MYDQDDRDELTAEERRLLAALPRERDPGPLLESRTVSALHSRGHLQTPSSRRRPGGWVVAALAAGLAVIFLGGVAVGQTLVARPSVELVTAASSANAEQVALLIQQTGSAYVAALSRLAELSDASDASDAASDRATRQGREVAARLLHAAADELLRSMPDERLAGAIQAGLHHHALGPTVPADSGGPRRIMWF